MPAFEPGKIRNVAVVGHRGTGKTSLVEALLFQAGDLSRRERRRGQISERRSAPQLQRLSQLRGRVLCASRPHRIATSGVPRATSALIAQSVTRSHPRPRWLPGLPGETVSTRLSNRTPCVVQGVRSPLAGCG